MDCIFSGSLLITLKVTENDTSCKSAAMAPVVNPGNQKTKNEQPQHPSTNLFVNSLAISTTPAFTVIKASAYEATDCGSGS